MNIVLSDSENKIYDFPIDSAFRTGRFTTPIDESELIKLPYGSFLFSLPDRKALSYDPELNCFEEIDQIEDDEYFAASAFLSSGYLRTYLPAYVQTDDAKPLSLWAYSAVVCKDGDFYVPAMRIDEDKRSDPDIHENDKELEAEIERLKSIYHKNRLLKQVSHCATEYRCLCARNLFLERYEAPIPTAPGCNARCLGCLSHQDEEDSGFQSAQFRLDFAPSAEEIAELISHHLKKVDYGVASFGQGCEGEPLTRGKDLAMAIELVRAQTNRGTINLNTNGSLPKMAREMIRSGLDSIRVSLNSPTEKYYNPYFRPQGYKFSDVIETIDISLDAGIHTALNLFFLPGFTDSEEEVESLYKFLEKHPVNMIQTRNLNIDPDFYLDTINFSDSEPIGIRNLISMLRRDFPKMKLGYYNPRLRL